MLEDHGVPGLGALKVSESGVEAIGSAGVRKVGDERPVQNGDPWHLGRCIQAMTATAFGTLVDESVFDWETTLTEAFPTLVLHSGYDAVPLRWLLDHRGGIPDSVPSDLSELLETPGDVAAQRAAFVEELLQRPPEYLPGFDFAPSDPGYIVVAAAMEAAMGRSWEDLMQERVFGPLQMESCGFGSPATPGEVDAPWGHDYLGNSIEPGSETWPPGLRPASNVHCSLADWGAFGIEHVRGARGLGTLMTSASYSELHTPIAYGFFAGGWYTGVSEESWALGTVFTCENSFIGGFNAKIRVTPGTGRVWAVATNIGLTQPEMMEDAFVVLQEH